MIRTLVSPGIARAFAVIAALAAASPLASQAPAIVIDSNVAVPMRDGVVLRADVWRPAATGRHPTLVYRTPYGKDRATAAFATARKAVARGYAVVLQDVRGRYHSDGEFLPYQQEGRDGYDTIEWAASQPWSNGSVGTFGLSYPGAVQWLAAIEHPPSLKAMVPAMTFASPNQFWYSNGVWDLSWPSWIYNNIAPDRRRRLGMGEGLPWDSVSERMRRTRPLLALADFDVLAPWYREWLRHPAFDPWWDWAELQDKYARTTAAVLNFSGWHDEAYGPHGATTNFAGLVRARAGRPPRTALIVGPWTHGVPRPDGHRSGEREYGPAGVIDYDETVLRWMDFHLRGVDNGVGGERPVRVFVLGSNRWLEADAWPPAGVHPDTLTLTRPGESTTIVSDPADPVRDTYDRYGAHDYRALAARPDVVVFETAPLARDLTVVGAMRASLHVSADAPDTDIWVKVHDVAPDGTAYNLMSPGLDVVRASYRSRRSGRELLRPGDVVALDVPDLLTANTFRRGHRIRVVITTAFAPGFSHNPHTGALESESADARTARVTIHHGGARPFRLVLPVLGESAMFSRP
jgi:uncharacterized protein